MADEPVAPIEPDAKRLARRASRRAWMRQYRASRTAEQIEADKQKALEYAAANRDNYTARMRIWRQNNKAHWEEYSRQYRARDDVKERQRQLRKAAHKPKPPRQKRVETAEQKRARTRLYRVRWLAKLTLEQKAYQAARERAKYHNRHSAEGSHTAQDIREIFVAQRGKCAGCRRSIKQDYHVDHIVALSNGGSNWRRNLQLLCPTCNLRKRTKHPTEFMQELGRLL